MALWSWILLANAVTFEGSPDVLRAQAVRVLRDCGLSVRGGEGAWWFFEDPAERRHLTRDGTANSRFVRSQVMSPGLWTADGKSVWFLSSRSGSMQVWKAPADGGEAVLWLGVSVAGGRVR